MYSNRELGCSRKAEGGSRDKSLGLVFQLAYLGFPAPSLPVGVLTERIPGFPRLEVQFRETSKSRPPKKASGRANHSHSKS